MSTHKELARRLRAKREIVRWEDGGPLVVTDLPDPDCQEAADLIESLPPPDGVGLTRYALTARYTELSVYPFHTIEPSDIGEWVRHEDAAAAFAAERARGDGLAKALTEAVTKVENDRTLWTPEWQPWLLDARAALSVQTEETNP